MSDLSKAVLKERVEELEAILLKVYIEYADHSKSTGSLYTKNPTLREVRFALGLTRFTSEQVVIDRHPEAKRWLQWAERRRGAHK